MSENLRGTFLTHTVYAVTVTQYAVAIDETLIESYFTISVCIVNEMLPTLRCLTSVMQAANALCWPLSLLSVQLQVGGAAGMRCDSDGD